MVTKTKPNKAYTFNEIDTNADYEMISLTNQSCLQSFTCFDPVQGVDDTFFWGDLNRT